MSDYLDKIQTQKKDGTPLATVPFRDSEAREDITTIQNELTTDTTTIEGNPLNFTTLSAQKSKSTIIDIEPIQDLHGYDKPWVGGAGKNLLPMTVDSIKANNILGTWNGNVYTYNNVNFSIITDANDNVIGIKANGQASADITFFIKNRYADSPFYLSAGSYTVNGCSDGSSSSYEIRFQATRNDNLHTFGADRGDGISGNVLNTDKLQVVCYLYANYNAQNLMFYPMLRLSTVTDASFVPYTNICPISGRSKIGILGCRKNLLPIIDNAGGTMFDVSWTNNYDGSWLVNGTANGGNSYPTSSGTKTINVGKLLQGKYTASVRDSNGNLISNMNVRIGMGNSATLVTSSSGKSTFDADGVNEYWFSMLVPNGKTISNTTVYLQLEKSNDATDYEPYTPSTDLTISLGRTVYGGTLDVEKGVLVVDRGLYIIDDNSNILINSNYQTTFGVNVDRILYYGDIGRIGFIKNTNLYFVGEYTPASTRPNGKLDSYDGLFDSQSGIWVSWRDDRFNTVADMKTYLASNPLTVIYKFDTPITLQLTPEQVKLLQSVNNISTTGDKITLTYRNGVFATLGDLLDLEKKLTDEEPYGFIEHMSILDPAQRIEYIGKNKNYSPMTINLSGDHLANYNGWYDFPVIKENKPYMIKADGTVDYALDPNDYTKKFDGSASDVANTSYTGGAFAWIPKTYKREFVVGDDRYVYISTKKLSDEYEAVGFIDENGLEHDGAWIPMFYGTEITQDNTVKIMSLATGTPSQSRDTATQKTYIENFSSQAKFFGGPIVNVLADLLIMLGKNSDVQAVFGTGNSSGGNGAQYMKANACINGGAFYGSTTNNVLNKAFHSLVLLTQNQWQRDPYTLCYKGEFWISPYYKYDLTGDSYVNTGVFVTPPSSNNWVYPHKSVSVPHWGAIPVGPYSGSTTTGWADGQYTLATQLTDTTVRVVLRFADCSTGRTGGPRCLGLGAAASDTGWDVGASPLLLSKEKIPN